MFSELLNLSNSLFYHFWTTTGHVKGHPRANVDFKVALHDLFNYCFTFIINSIIYISVRTAKHNLNRHGKI